jgi:acyl carrier protein
MENLARLEHAFVEGLSIRADTDFSTLAYRSVEEWDSVAHMLLVAQVEETFGVMLETQDVIDMNSFARAREILTGYGVSFEGDE